MIEDESAQGSSCNKLIQHFALTHTEHTHTHWWTGECAAAKVQLPALSAGSFPLWTHRKWRAKCKNNGPERGKVSLALPARHQKKIRDIPNFMALF